MTQDGANRRGVKSRVDVSVLVPQRDRQPLVAGSHPAEYCPPA